jgi:hypothetical protein
MWKVNVKNKDWLLKILMMPIVPTSVLDDDDDCDGFLGSAQAAFI